MLSFLDAEVAEMFIDLMLKLLKSVFVFSGI